jgi:hypothetical protein
MTYTKCNVDPAIGFVVIGLLVVAMATDARGNSRELVVESSKRPALHGTMMRTQLSHFNETQVLER